jgi:hypothetical protein
MTQPQPLPPDAEAQQPQDTGQEAEAVATIAALLAAASAAGATYMSGQVAQAGIVNALRGLGLTRKQAGKLVELDAARPSPPVIPLQPATRAVFRDGPTYRAHYLVNAAKRILNAAAPGGQSLGDAVDAERRYFAQHRTAQVQREQAAARIDAAANSYGPLVGWYSRRDDRVTPACEWADGKNFHPAEPPTIGMPGMGVHAGCRCYPGPPHEGGELIGSVPTDIAASSTGEAVELSAKTAYYSEHHHELGTPGGPGLWKHKGWELPNYITNIAKGIMESGQLDKSRAIEIAVGKVRDWAEGKGNVSPEVRAAAVKAIAEWEALRARAKATKLSSATPAVELATGTGSSTKLDDKSRQEMADNGEAMPDGSFPIRTRRDVLNAIHAIGRAAPERRAAVKAHIIRRAKALGAPRLIPPSWRTQEHTAEPAQEIEMAKPMFGGKKPTAKDVRDMVAAHGKVPDQLKEKYRAKVIGHARAANAMHHIPPAWLKGKTAPAAGKGKPFGGKQAAPFGSK